MTLQERLLEIADESAGLAGSNYYDHSEIKPTIAQTTEQIEKDILELIIGKDEPVLNPDIPRGASWHNRMTRNELRAELRLKLKEYIGGAE